MSFGVLTIDVDPVASESIIVIHLFETFESASAGEPEKADDAGFSFKCSSGRERFERGICILVIGLSDLQWVGNTV